MHEWGQKIVVFLDKLMGEAFMGDVLDIIQCFDLKIAQKKDVFVLHYW